MSARQFWHQRRYVSEDDLAYEMTHGMLWGDVTRDLGMSLTEADNAAKRAEWRYTPRMCKRAKELSRRTTLRWDRMLRTGVFPANLAAEIELTARESLILHRWLGADVACMSEA